MKYVFVFMMLLVAASITAALSKPGRKYVEIGDNKLAIGYASVIMASETELDVDKWMVVQVVKASIPLPEGGMSAVPITSVYYTTAVTVTECDDGTLSYSRFGEGVDLWAPREGVVFNWADSGPCTAESPRNTRDLKREDFKSHPQADAPIDPAKIAKEVL